MKKLLLVLLLLSGVVTAGVAQDLRQMPEKERNDKLLKEAKKAIKEYAPDYYKYTNGNYKIEFTVVNRGSETEEPVYAVTFLDYNSDYEFFSEGFPVWVWFHADSGVIWAIVSGHGVYLVIPDKPLTRGQKVKQLKYVRTPPPSCQPDGRFGWPDK